MSDATKHMCPCGRTGVKKIAGSWACARCIRCEERGCVGGPQGETIGKKNRGILVKKWGVRNFGLGENYQPSTKNPQLADG